MIFEKLHILSASCDEVFDRFYKNLLSSKSFAKHFRNSAQIDELLVKQKKNFIDSLNETRQQIFSRYYDIGVIHYQHDIPYELFLSGSQILKDTFDEVIAMNQLDSDLVLLSNTYFTHISNAMAKGYLDQFIENDRKDAEKMLGLIQTSTFGVEKELLTLHYSWLIMLLTAIQEEDLDALVFLCKQHESDEGTMYGYIKTHLRDLSRTFSDAEIDRIRFRIVTNTESIFFYLQRKAYSDALALVINILEIYKLTLILDNVITNIIVKKAEIVIDEKVRLSETDPLTNVMNRRKFDEVLESLVLRAHKTAQPLAISVIDLDDFKSINDQYGHARGDDVLVEVSSIIKNMVRKNDFLVRYGGEEFVIVSSETDSNGAAQMAEKIRQSVEQSNLPNIGNITLSIGVAQLNRNDDHKTLFQRADSKLYEAKTKGKNRICY